MILCRSIRAYCCSIATHKCICFPNEESIKLQTSTCLNISKLSILTTHKYVMGYDTMTWYFHTNSMFQNFDFMRQYFYDGI